MCRVWCLTAYRNGLFLMLSFRQTGVGAALVLEQTAPLGWRGALADTARLLIGKQGP